MREAGILPTTISPEELEAAVRNALAKREEYLNSAIKNHLECLRALGDSEVLGQQLIAEVEAFTDYIDERVLWVQSAKTFEFRKFRLCAGILQRGCATKWSEWLNVAGVWREDAKDHSVVYALVTILS